MEVGDLSLRAVEGLMSPVVPGVVWDLLTGEVGVRAGSRIVKAVGTPGVAVAGMSADTEGWVAVNAFCAEERRVMPVCVKGGDFLYVGDRLLGWVVEGGMAGTAGNGSRCFRLMRFKLESVECGEVESVVRDWTPTETELYETVGVVRPLFRVLGGCAGLQRLKLAVAKEALKLHAIKPGVAPTMADLVKGAILEEAMWATKAMRT